MATALTTPGVWSARDTTPAEIEAALLRLMHERANEGMVHAPARVLNLVVVIDRDRKGEISNRLDRINRDNPARTILVVVEEGKQDLDAMATLIHDQPDALGSNTVFRERIEIDCGTEQLEHLDTIIYPVLATEVGTVVWSPHGHPEAVDALRGLATTVLIDSLDIPEWHDAITRIAELSEHAEVSDLAWLRSNPWRERVAAAFDPDVWRPELDAINRVVVRMHPGSTLAALLWLGWIASRLEWQPHVMDLDKDDHKSGHATGAAGQIELVIENDDTMPVPGLSGLTIETTNGLSLSLDRGVGGLRATRVLPSGAETDWTILGASRGEDGILAHGVTNALIPDRLFRPALEAACAFGGRASIAKALGK
ncbi:MAG: glucose-6-phosphate dehydrogenase assembly protein OpcA [Thermoleophilaceae bacterium]|nr:glucose-6-phosphate dehydrogenase assembly protein OpcA [Thermoleophilaceae bacterium]